MDVCIASVSVLNPGYSIPFMKLIMTPKNDNAVVVHYTRTYLTKM